MANNRSVVFEGTSDCQTCEETGETCGVCQAKQDIVQELASKWNILHNEDEARSFRSREDREVDAEIEAEFMAEMTEAEQAAHLKKKQADAQARIDRKSAIEELLSHYGARMARPYEHWNEEEWYMEYMETKNDYLDDRE